MIQVVSLEIDIGIWTYLLSPSLFGPFGREAKDQRGPVRGAWSGRVASNQSGTTVNSIRLSTWRRPCGVLGKPEWVLMCWVGGVRMVAHGRLDDQGRSRIVLGGKERPEYSVLCGPKPTEVWRGKPTQMRCEKSDQPIVAMKLGQ